MIRSAKKKAEMVLSANNSIYIVTLIFVILKIMIAAAVNLLFERLPLGAWHSTVIYVVLTFIIFPIELSFFNMFVEKRFDATSLFSFYDIKKLPQVFVLCAIQTSATLLSNILSTFLKGRHVENPVVLLIVILTIILIVLILFLLSGIKYFFAKNSCSAITAVKESFKFCSNNVFKIILFELSFALWYVLWVMIFLMLNKIGLSENLISMLNYSMLGVGIFFYPKHSQSKVFFFDEIIEATQK